MELQESSKNKAPIEIISGIKNYNKAVPVVIAFFLILVTACSPVKSTQSPSVFPNITDEVTTSPMTPTQPTVTPTFQVPTVTSIPPGTKIVVIDTDMAMDDWMAILYLLQRPDIIIQAITVTGTGEAHCESGVKNALGLVALAGNNPIPVACGRETPLQGDHVFPENWRASVDSVFGINLPTGNNPSEFNDANDLLLSVIQGSQQKVTLLTLGPLTTIAELVQTTPSIIENLETIYVMGGAVDVAGNIATSGVPINNRVAEWNIYIDPVAANIVFKSGAPITMVGLDATNHTPLKREFYDRVKENHLTPEAEFLLKIYDTNQWYFDSNQMYFWDQVTSVVLTDESFSTFEPRSICVVEEEGTQSGRTKSEANCPEIRVAFSIDREKFESLFLGTLNLQTP